MVLQTQKAKSPANRAKCLIYMGWLMGLEPTTTRITTLETFAFHLGDYRVTSSVPMSMFRMPAIFRKQASLAVWLKVWLNFSIWFQKDKRVSRH